MKLVSVKPARDGIHKYVAHFVLDTGRDKNVKFGAKGYSDYTMNKDPERKQRYLKRHRGMGENWNDPTTPGALSRWILWEYPEFDQAVREFRKRFELK
jgi:hypothetical protein